MLNRLRWQLTLLYLGAACGLVVIIGAGSYSLLNHYLQSTTDLAIQYRMATLFMQSGLPLPAELAKARQAWLAGNPASGSGAVGGVQAKPTPKPAASDENEGEDQPAEQPDETAYDDYYDGRLASVFVFPLDSEGNVLANPNPAPPPMKQEIDALSGATSQGVDWRTIQLPNGGRVRLLTYQTGAIGAVPAYFQVGRLISDEDRVLSRFLTGLILTGGLSILLLGGGSWWLSGCSLGPAQKAWDQQQTFVSNASHELRTPLTLVRASADYGLRLHPDGEQQAVLNDILQEADYMNRLVDDLLLLSRLDARRLKLDRTILQLPDLLSDTARQFEKLAAAKAVQLVYAGASGQVWGDPARVRQVLLILLDNALRFTPAGGSIHLTTQPQGKYVQIQVADTGIGIPPEHQPHLFERFYQVRPPGGDENRSNGLGLSIGKALVEIQGGHIHLDSQVGKGTCVTISLLRASG